MSRTRKYRVWDPEDRAFAYFTLSDIDARGGIKTPHGWARVSEIDEALLTEYTGRKADDGTDVYEGDICEGEYTGSAAGIYRNVVKWDAGANGWSFANAPLWAWDSLKVIGNVWQNPELLKP